MISIKTRLVLLISFLFSLAQVNKAQYIFCKENLMSNTLSDLVQTSDGGYVIGGTCDVLINQNNDFQFIKTDASGNVLWTKTVGGAGIDWGYSLIQSSDKGLVMVGYTKSFGMGNDDVYVVKLDSIGNTLWTRTIGGTQNEVGTSIVQTLDGGYVIAGNTKSYGAGNNDTYIIKLDAAGNLAWTKTIGGPGNDSFLLGTSIIQTSDSGYAVAGCAQFDSQGLDLYLIKLNQNGNLVWTKSVGGSAVEEPAEIVETSDKSYVIAGRTGSFGASELYLVKFNSTGSLIWTKTYNPGGLSTCSGMCKTDDQGFVLIGKTNVFGGYYDAYMIKVDSVGSFQWSRGIGSSDGQVTVEPSKIIQSTDGGFAFCGGTRTFTNGPTFMSAYFAKLDANGNGCCMIAENTGTVGAGGSLNLTGGTASSGGTVSSGGSSASAGSLTTICYAVGINEMVSSVQMQIGPNPLVDQMYLKIERNLDHASMKVYNSIGKVVKELTNLNGDNFILNRENLTNGFYLITLTEGEKVIGSKKLIVSD